MNDLANDYIEYVAQEIEVEKETFLVNSEESANWCLMKIAIANENIAEIDAYVEREIARIQAFAQKKRDIQLSTISFMEGKLHPYIANRLAEENKNKKKPVKSILLLNGRCGFKAASRDIERDEDQAIAWAEKNAPDMVERKLKLKWGELKKTLIFDGGQVMSKDGEILDFIKYEDHPDKFYTEVK